MNTRFFGDITVLLGRTLRHITRSPDTIITVSVMPIAMMLLFRYVFGGAINTGQGADQYTNYVLPGILLITIATGISYTSLRLFTDLQTGIFARFQSMPIARSAVLWAHVLTPSPPTAAESREERRMDGVLVWRLSWSPHQDARLKGLAHFSRQCHGR